MTETKRLEENVKALQETVLSLQQKYAVRAEVEQFSEKLLLEVKSTSERLRNESREYRESIDSTTRTLVTAGSLFASVIAIIGAGIGVKSCADARSRIEDVTKSEIVKYVTKDRAEQLLDQSIQSKTEAAIIGVLSIDAADPQATEPWNPTPADEQALDVVLSEPSSVLLDSALSAVGNVARRHRLTPRQSNSYGREILKLLATQSNSEAVLPELRLSAIDALVALRYMPSAELLLQQVKLAGLSDDLRIRIARRLSSFPFDMPMHAGLGQALLQLSKADKIEDRDWCEYVSLAYPVIPEQVIDNILKQDPTRELRKLNALLTIALNFDTPQSDSRLDLLLRDPSFSLVAGAESIPTHGSKPSPPTLYALYDGSKVTVRVDVKLDAKNVFRLGAHIATRMRAAADRKSAMLQLVAPMALYGRYLFRYEQGVGYFDRSADILSWRDGFSLRSSKMPTAVTETLLGDVTDRKERVFYRRANESDLLEMQIGDDDVDYGSIQWMGNSYQAKEGGL